MQTIRAAIYARRSKEQKGKADDALSVTRQVELAREFAASKGWQVSEDHIYIDHGFSGAEFEKRPGLQKLLAAAQSPRPPFSMLVVSERKSIGRETDETGFTIKQLANADIKVWTYTGRCLTPTTWLDKMVAAVESGSDEAYRETTSARTHETHAHKARQGYVVGGRVFGYRNVDVISGTDHHGRPVRSHVVREINPDEAAVVRRIFELYDSGVGYKRIARILTSEGAVAVPGHNRKDGLTNLGIWTPGTVRTVLGRELYRGVAVWNKSRKRAEGYGHVKQRRRPESEWVRTPVPDLAIIDDDLWKRVQARRSEIEGKQLRFAGGRLVGRPPKHTAVNLLAGIATCGALTPLGKVCGGGLIVEMTGKVQGSRRALYVCARRKVNHLACTNELRMPATELNEAVLQAIEEHALTPEAIEQVIALTERDDLQEQEAMLRRERQDLTNRLARLLDAIETGGDAPTLTARVRELEAKRASIDADIAALRPVPRLAPAVVEGRLAEWRRLLRSSVVQGRAVLQRVLQGRIVFTPTPDGQGYSFEAPTRFDKLFTGITAEPPPDYIDRNDQRGKEHITPADTFDADYSRLLEAAQRTLNRWRARQDSNLRPLAPEANALSS